MIITLTLSLFLFLTLFLPPPPPSLSLSLHTDQSSTDNLAAIIGGVVGGLIVLGFAVAITIIVILLMILCSSRKGINVLSESVHSYDNIIVYANNIHLNV